MTPPDAQNARQHMIARLAGDLLRAAVTNPNINPRDRIALKDATNNCIETAEAFTDWTISVADQSHPQH